MRVPTACSLVLTLVPILVLATVGCASNAHADPARWQPVSGSGTHFFSTAIVHKERPTDSGVVIRSTDTIDLQGDLTGRILYHPRTVIDQAQGTLVNTGHQVFSGTVLGGAPVLLLDDDFRFEVNLATGATIGHVFLERTLAGRPTRCMLEVVGTGQTAEGNSTVAYTGWCRQRRRERR